MGKDTSYFIAGLGLTKVTHKQGKSSPHRDTLWAFRGGLNAGLHQSILQFVRPAPTTMDEWQCSAREQQAIFVEMKMAFPLGKGKGNQ